MLDPDLMRMQREINDQRDHMLDALIYSMYPTAQMTRWQKIKANIQMWLRELRGKL